MTTINISLPETLKEYVEHRVTVGGYGTTSEYLRELIREDRKRIADEKLEELLMEGINSGEAKPLVPDFWEKLWHKIDDKSAHLQKSA